MTLRLHWSPDSANLVIRIALEMLDLPFEGVRVDRSRSEHQGAAYRRLNPQGLLPVLEDGELVLFETGAILWHLAEKTGKLGPDGPAFDDAVARAASLKWMFYLSNTVHADLRLAFYAGRYVDSDAEKSALRTVVARRLAGHLDLMESELSARPDPSGVLLTDIYAVMLCRWAQIYPATGPMIPGSLAPWPGIEAVARRIEADPRAVQAFQAESIPTKAPLTAPEPPDLPATSITGV